jgi:hypothetical protein
MTVAKVASIATAIAIALSAGCDTNSGSAGIDGTGAPLPNTIVAQNIAYGSVTAIGSVWLNGVRYDTSSAEFVIDGVPGSQADIEQGDVVLVVGRAGAVQPVAERVIVDDAVEGPIAEIDLMTSSFVALGQAVRVTPATIFDDTVPRAALDGLAVGDTVEVSGFRNSAGDVIATRIEKKPDASAMLETTGAIERLNIPAQRFNVKDLIVHYGAAGSAAPKGLREGDIVEVKGLQLLPSGELVAASVEVQSIVTGAAGDHVDMQGFVTAVDSRDPNAFRVAGVPSRTTTDTVIDDVAVALDAKIAVKGSLDASGVVVASNLRRGGFIGETSGAYAIAGRVFDARSGIVDGARVDAWVQRDRFGYSYSWANGLQRAGNSGEFVLQNLPQSRVSLFATKPGFEQPCMHSVDVPPSSFVQIEMVAESTLAALDPPRPQVLRGAPLTGSVFTIVDGARVPVPGARLWVQDPLEVNLATTRTDLRGKFFLCNLPPRVLVSVTKEGFVTKTLWPVDGANPTAIDVQIERR